MESKVKISLCESKSIRSCAQRLEEELKLLPEFRGEVNSLTDRLIKLYEADPEGIRPFLIHHVVMIMGCISAQNTLYRAHYGGAAKRQGLCDTAFLQLHIEKLYFFKSQKDLLCLFIFNDHAQLQLMAALSPRQALDRISPNVEIVLVELGTLPPGQELSKKKRFERLIQAGYFEFRNIRYAPKMEQLEKAAIIVGCSLRYLQELVDGMKIDGRDPFPGAVDKDGKDRLLGDFNQN